MHNMGKKWPIIIFYAISSIAEWFYDMFLKKKGIL